MSAVGSGDVQSVAVATQILEILADSNYPVRVTDIAQTLEMTKARISRHLSTLSKLGLVSKDPIDQRYRLGWLVYRLGQRAMEQHEIVKVALPFMQALRDEVGEFVLLALPLDGDVLVANSLESGKLVSPSIANGRRLMAPSSPTAMVALAFSEESVVEDLIDRRSQAGAKNQLSNIDDLRGNLQQIKEGFVQWDSNPHGSNFPVLAAPVFNHADELEAVISMVMTGQDNKSNEPEQSKVKAICHCAAEISAAMGSKRWLKVI